MSTKERRKSVLNDVLNKLKLLQLAPKPPRRMNRRRVLGIGHDLGFFDNNTVRYKDQNYRQLKAACLRNGTLFEDDKFPCSPSSILPTQAAKVPSAIKWLRPKEINLDACLVSRSEDEKHLIIGRDVCQGRLGNCWFIAACSVLAGFPKLWHEVIPDYKEQDMDKRYAGIFHFRFWLFSQWHDVVIDDRLPTIDGKLIFCHSERGTEFWGPLLEKAYAKLNGSYTALDGGNLVDVLVDFTGGVAQTLEIAKEFQTYDQKLRLFEFMEKELQYNSLMCAGITADSMDEMEALKPNGLIKGHAYGITDVKTVHNADVPGLLTLLARGDAVMRLVRLRNPWGRKEWNGRFSDGSPEWNHMSDSKRAKLGLKFEDDGEFWMDFDDFIQEFSTFSICRIIYTSFVGTLLNGGAKCWSEGLFEDRWTRPYSAGGCPNFKPTFFKNPQYRFDVVEDDEEILISLAQPDLRRRRSSNLQRTEYLTIGFYIMKVEINRNTCVTFFKEQAAVSAYSAARTVTLRPSLKQGRYCIVPSTFDPDEEGEFLLRILTSVDCNAKKLEPKIPKRRVSLLPIETEADLSCVTSVTIKSVRGLKPSRETVLSILSGAGETCPDPFVSVECEGVEVETPVIRNTLNPVFNVAIVFYRKDPESPIVLQVLNHNHAKKDTFLGEAYIFLSGIPYGQTVRLELPLHAKEDLSSVMPGVVEAEVATFQDLHAV